MSRLQLQRQKMASKVKVADTPAGGPDLKQTRAAPPPDKSDFPATPAQSAQKVQQDKLDGTVLPSKEEGEILEQF